MSKKIKALIAVFSLVLCSCSPSRSGRVYSFDDAQRALEVSYATVASVQEVRIEGKRSPAGSIGGTAMGASIGYGVIQGPFRPAVMIASGLIGMTVGPWVEERIKRKRAYEIELRGDDGRTSVLVQEDDQEFRPGERVRITRDSSGALRVRPISSSAMLPGNNGAKQYGTAGT